MNEKGIAKKGIIIILFICLALIVTSCSKGQTEAANNQTAQGVTASSVQTQNKKENHAEPIKVNMSVEQKKELDDFFSVFSKGGLRPFAEGQLRDDDLTSFVLWNLGTEGKGIKHVSGVDATNMETQYFGRCVQAKEQQNYGENHWRFENGIFTVIGHPGFGGYTERFSQIDELWDRGDGTFTTLVSVYLQPEEWEGNRYGNPEEWKPGPSGESPELSGKYRAIIRLVVEGRKNHYILLEYLRDN